MATKRERKPRTEPPTVEADAPTAEFPDPDAPIVITAVIDAVIDPVDFGLVGPEPEREPPPPGFITAAPEIPVFPVADDDDAERRLAIAEWKRVTPRSERLRHPFEG
jgi:hypothetical protein